MFIRRGTGHAPFVPGTLPDAGRAAIRGPVWIQNDIQEATLKKTAFLFPGQGSQTVGMGHDFYQEFDFIRELFDMADEITKRHISRLCFKGPMEDLTQTVNLQPAVTTLNLACLAVLEREGIGSNICAGHSLGEFSALCSAGIMSREDTIGLVDQRGRLMHREAEKNSGAMHAVIGLSIETVQEIVDEVRREGIVAVANHNAEKQIVITGAPDSVKKVSAMAAAKGARAIPLKVSGAWHSDLMKGAEKEFMDALSGTEFIPPGVPVVHNVTADVAGDPLEIQNIMGRQLCSPVKWYDSMCRMMAEGVEVFVEVGPGRVLSGLLKKILPKEYPYSVFAVNSLKTFEKFLGATR